MIPNKNVQRFANIPRFQPLSMYGTFVANSRSAAGSSCYEVVNSLLESLRVLALGYTLQTLR